MKKLLFIVSIILFSFSYSAHAQFGSNLTQTSLAQSNKSANNSNARGSERIKQLKTVYMVKELEIKRTEQTEFWKTYGLYEEELNRVWIENKNDKASFDDKCKKLQNKYSPDFRRILGSEERANKVFVTDIAFRQMLRKELKGRRD